MLLIEQGIIHTVEPLGSVQGGILVDSGRIIQVGGRIDPPLDTQIISARGLHVYPGLIDAHSHIGISEEKVGTAGDDCNEGTAPITPFARAIDAINPMDSAFHSAIAAGITGAMVGPGSANPIGGQFTFIKTDGRCIDDMAVLSPAAIKIAFGENPKNNFGTNGNMPSTRMGIAAMIRRELSAAADYLNQNPVVPDSPNFELECYRPLFEGKIPLKAHAHRADDILTAIRIAGEFGLSVTLDHCTEGHLIAGQIAQSGFPAIVGPSLASRNKIEVEQSDFETVGILAKAGVLVAITTDHPVTRIQYLPLCAALAAKKGLGEEEALRAITINAARICRIEHRIGSLTPGKDADIIITDGSPFEIKTEVMATIINGKPVYQNERFNPRA